MSQALAYDVSHLPGTGEGPDAPVWWGNTLLMAIETMTVALLVATYFYVAQKIDMFPPPRVGVMPPLHEPLPRLGFATADLAVMIVSGFALRRAHLAARVRASSAALRWLVVGSLLGAAAIAARCFEFRDVHVGWDQNAYGSIVWGILVMHLLYLVLAVAEALYAAAMVELYGLDDNLAVDIEVTAAYWYWTVGAWVVFYLVVFWTPRIW